MKRRGAAFDIAAVMTFEKHEEIIEFLFEDFFEGAPEGYSKLTIDQIRKAD